MGGTIIEPRAGKIPFISIDCYAKRYGIDGGAFDLLCMVIVGCDAEFLEIEAERAKERAAARAAS